MTKKFVNWLNRPITWKGYLKFAAWCMAISTAIWGTMAVVFLYGDRIRRWYTNSVTKIRRFFRR